MAVHTKAFIDESFAKCEGGKTFTIRIDEALKKIGVFCRSQKEFRLRRFKNKRSKSKV